MTRPLSADATYLGGHAACSPSRLQKASVLQYGLCGQCVRQNSHRALGLPLTAPGYFGQSRPIGAYSLCRQTA